MKNRSLKYPLLIISFCFISAKLFAQPSDPGDDPMRADSAKYIVTLKPTENKQLTSHSNILPSKKDKDSNKTRENVQLNKNEEKITHPIF
jgi:flagellar motor switch protein FliG